MAASSLTTPERKVDADHSISVCAGHDNLKQIGEPQGASNRSNVSIEMLWQELCENNFKKVKSDET